MSPALTRRAFISVFAALTAAVALGTFLHPHRPGRPVITSCGRGCCGAKTYPPQPLPRFGH